MRSMRAPANTLIKQDNDSSYTPSGPSRLTSVRGALRHKSSSAGKESIQSPQTSLSNFSTHDDAPSAIDKDREDISVSDFNYYDTPQKSIFSLQNESPSTVYITPGVEPDRRSRVGARDNVDESLAHRRPAIRCYHCQQGIAGARFRCVDCTTIDIDLCWNCEIAGFHGDLDVSDSDSGHNSSHAMLKADDQGKIPMSLNTQEIQRVTRRADDLRHAGDRADLHIVSPSAPSQRVLPDGSVDLMPVISSNPYPTTSLEGRLAPPSKGPRPSHGASLTSQPPNPSLHPPYGYPYTAPPSDFPPAPFANKGVPVPLDGPVNHPHLLPPLMTPQVPVTGRNMDMHTAQSFGEDQGMGIRAPGFRMDMPKYNTHPPPDLGSAVRAPKGSRSREYWYGSHGTLPPSLGPAVRPRDYATPPLPPPDEEVFIPSPPTSDEEDFVPPQDITSIPRRPIAPDPPLQHRRTHAKKKSSRGPPRPLNIVFPAPYAYPQDEDGAPVLPTATSTQPQRSHRPTWPSTSIFVEPPSSVSGRMKAGEGDAPPSPPSIPSGFSVLKSRLPWRRNTAK